MSTARFPIQIKASVFLILALGLVGCRDGGGLNPIVPTGSNSSEAGAQQDDGQPFSLRTRLLIAVIDRDIETVQQLLDQGAKPDDALGLAVDRLDFAMVELLLNEGAIPNQSTMMRGVVAVINLIQGHDVLELLLSRGAKPDWRALFAAVRHDEARLILILLREMDVNATDEAGNTALDQALIKQLPEIADLLRSLGGEEGNGDRSRLN